MQPIEYQKPKVTVDEQLKELRRYVDDKNIYYYLNALEIKRKKNVTYNLLGNAYLIGIIYLLYMLFNKTYDTLWYLAIIEIVLTVIGAVIIKYIDRCYHDDFIVSCTNYAIYLFDRNKYTIEGTEDTAQSQYEYFAVNAIKTVLDETVQDVDFFNNVVDKL